MTGRNDRRRSFVAKSLLWKGFFGTVGTRKNAVEKTKKPAFDGVVARAWKPIWERWRRVVSMKNQQRDRNKLAKRFTEGRSDENAENSVNQAFCEAQGSDSHPRKHFRECVPR